jgi:phage regulator Rha-like protein
MNSIVTVERGELMTDTQIIAKALDTKHAYVMRVVEQFLEDFPDLRVTQNHPKTLEKIRLEKRHYRGKDFTAAVMNRECFTLLVMRFENSKAREMQRKFNAAFYEMERALLREKANSEDPAWIAARQQAKAIRLSETDVIKDFVEYAKGQGSKGADHYYKHITNATYKCLELLQAKKPKLRETLDILDMAHLMAAEGLAARSLRHYMTAGEHYKAVFELVKHDLERFASGLMLHRHRIGQEKEE